MRNEDMTPEEKVELFHHMQERHREETYELRQTIEEQRQMIENLFRLIEDRRKAYEELYKRYLNLIYQKPNDEG